MAPSDFDMHKEAEELLAQRGLTRPRDPVFPVLGAAIGAWLSALFALAVAGVREPGWTADITGIVAGVIVGAFYWFSRRSYTRELIQTLAFLEQAYGEARGSEDG